MSTNPQPTTTGTGAAGGQDYLDKAFEQGAKKFGGAQGQKIAANRAMSEKIVCLLPFPFPAFPSFHNMTS